MLLTWLALDLSHSFHVQRKPMLDQHSATIKDHGVSVMYGDRSHAFLLARGTTLGELAVRVSDMVRQPNEAPLGLKITGTL